MSKIVAIGACVMDTLISTSVYPTEDTKMKADAIECVGGGPAATAVVASSKLGVSSAFIGNLSDDSAGAFLKSDFERYGVDTSGITLIAGERAFTSYVLLSAESTSRTCVFDRGTLPRTQIGVKQLGLLKNCELLEVDGNDLDCAVEAAKIVRVNGGKVLYDAGGLYEGVERLLKETDIMIPSEEFALGHTGEKTAEDSAKKLYETYNPEIVVITQGKKGGILYNGDKIISYPIYPAKVVDSNGAGDVFHGAFSAAVVLGYDYEKCCHFSSAVSGLKCTGVGARRSVPDFETVKNYLKENGYEL